MNCLKSNDPGSARVRSWSSSHVDSVGESAHSRQSAESHETWRRIRLQQILYRSVVQNDIDMVIKCLRHGADLSEEYTPYFQTVLHESARRGYLKMTELLLRAGANPNAADEKSFLPLHYACQEGHHNTVKCLLLYGSMVTVENEYGDAPIHTAARYGRADLLPLLLSVDPRRDFDNRKIPERYERQEHIDLQNANGDTCLHIASALDRKTIVKRLLLWGADPTLVNQQGLTPLDVAGVKQRISIVRLLRNPPPAMEKPAYSVEMVDGPVQQQMDQEELHFQKFEGLQRYTEEATRHRLEHEGLPRTYLEPIIPKAMSTDDLSEHSRSQSTRQDFSSVRPLPRISPSLLSSDIPPPSNMSSKSKAMRHIAAVGHKVWPTKLVELEPQPNNVQREPPPPPSVVNNTRRRRNDLLLQQDRGRGGSHDSHHILEVRDVRQKSTNDPRLAEKVNHRIDALSLEVDEKLKALRTQYSQLERREEILRQTISQRKEMTPKDKSPSRRKGDRSEITVIYENGGLIEVKRARSSSRDKKKQQETSHTSHQEIVRSQLEVKGGQEESRSEVRRVDEKSHVRVVEINRGQVVDQAEVNRVQVKVGGGQAEVDQRHAEVDKGQIDANQVLAEIRVRDLAEGRRRDSRSLSSSSSSAQSANITHNIEKANGREDQDSYREQERRVSHTYFIPPPPKLPERGLTMVERNTWIRDGKVISVVKEVNPPMQTVDLDEPDEGLESSTRVTDYRNGKRKIREAPKIKDMYGARVGRVSPKIRGLQEQLRRSQYRQVNYDLYDDDDDYYGEDC